MKITGEFHLSAQPHGRPSDEFINRLIQFYAGQPKPTVSPLWESVMNIYQMPLHLALVSKDAAMVGEILHTLYDGQYVWGLDDWNEKSNESGWIETLHGLVWAIGIGNGNLTLDEALHGIDDYFGVKVGRAAAGGMVGLLHEGRFIPRKFLESLIVAASLKRIAQWPPAAILELGAGLGFLCSAVNLLLPNVTYHTMDLPIASVLQAYMLQACVGENAIWLNGEERHGQPIKIHGLTTIIPYVDLAINQDSLPEMPEQTQANYLGVIQDALRVGGAFVSVNHEDDRPGERYVRLAMDGIIGMKLKSRHPYWGRVNYVEEVWIKE